MSISRFKLEKGVGISGIVEWTKRKGGVMQEGVEVPDMGEETTTGRSAM